MKRWIVLSFAVTSAAALFACGSARPPTADGIAVAPVGDADGGFVHAVDADAAPSTEEPDVSSPAEDADAPAVVPDAAPEAGSGSYDPAAICPASVVLGAGTLLPISTAEDDSGLSVTPDGLSAAWTTAAGGIVTVHYVDRASATDGFGPARLVTGAFGSRRVALQHDGLGLALVNADGLGFAYLARADRTQIFAAATTQPFELLAAQGIEDLAPAGERFDNPVFARGDMFLFYTRVGPTASRTFVSTRFSTSAPFAGGAPFAEAALGGEGEGGQRRVVTGASEDVRTLFVWDEVAEKSRLVTLTASSAVAGDVELGTMRDVQPSADCTTFWFARGGDLFRQSLP